MAYAELEDLKAWLNITKDSADAILTDLLDVATEQVHTITGQAFPVIVEEQEAEERVYYTGRDGTYLEIDPFDYDEGAGILVNGYAYEVTDYSVEVPKEGFPATRLLGYFGPYAEVTVTAIFGWPEVPRSVRLATLMLASRLYERRQSPSGVMGTSDIGLIRVTGSDRDVERLLEPYTVRSKVA